MLSQKCKYALRTILHLAVQKNPSQKKSIKDLAEDLKIPTPFLGKILQELVPKHLLSSVKGPGGGFYLTPDNLKMPAIKVVEAVDGLSVFESCGLGLTRCSDQYPCPIHNEFKEVRDRLKTVFADRTIAALAKDIKTHEYILVR